jgi:hypothetical protein
VAEEHAEAARVKNDARLRSDTDMQIRPKSPLRSTTVLNFGFVRVFFAPASARSFFTNDQGEEAAKID